MLKFKLAIALSIAITALPAWAHPPQRNTQDFYICGGDGGHIIGYTTASQYYQIEALLNEGWYLFGGAGGTRTQIVQALVKCEDVHDDVSGKIHGVDKWYSDVQDFQARFTNGFILRR